MLCNICRVKEFFLHCSWKCVHGVVVFFFPGTSMLVERDACIVEELRNI